MKRTLLLTACILLGGIVATSASARGSHTTVIALDQSCDKFDVTVTKVGAVALDAPSCAATFGGGVVGSVKGQGAAIVLSLQDPSQPGVQFVLQLSYPLTDGGTFTIYQTTDGLNIHDAQDGQYSIETDKTASVPAEGLKSFFRR